MELRQNEVEKMDFYRTYCNTESMVYGVCKYDRYWSCYKRLTEDVTYEGAVAKAVEASKRYGCTVYVLNDDGRVIFDVTR